MTITKKTKQQTYFRSHGLGFGAGFELKLKTWTEKFVGRATNLDQEDGRRCQASVAADVQRVAGGAVVWLRNWYATVPSIQLAGHGKCKFRELYKSRRVFGNGMSVHFR